MIRGRLPPAHVGVVDDVVMEERGGVDEFDYGGQGVASFPLITA